MTAERQMLGNYSATIRTNPALIQQFEKPFPKNSLGGLHKPRVFDAKPTLLNLHLQLVTDPGRNDTLMMLFCITASSGTPWFGHRTNHSTRGLLALRLLVQAASVATLKDIRVRLRRETSVIQSLIAAPRHLERCIRAKTAGLQSGFAKHFDV